MIKTLFEKVIDKITMFNYFTIFYQLLLSSSLYKIEFNDIFKEVREKKIINTKI